MIQAVSSRFVLAAATAWMAACTGGPLLPEPTTESNAGALVGGVHLMLKKVPGVRAAEAAPAGAHLTYYGGPVISNVKVYDVFWKSNVNYQSQLDAYQAAITNSAYFDWLTEYNTTVSGGTNQTIGRGSFIGSGVDPAPPASTNLTDAQIGAELARLIDAGTVPSGDPANTLYMLYFPPGYTLTDPAGHQSCSFFCAYHSTISHNGHNVYYGVIPDLGGGCASGCGTGNQFQNTTMVSSHEMIEAVTDGAIGLATTFAAPLAWYDQNNGEIGDICNQTTGTLAGYTVQYEWSNQSNACILTRAPTNDFSIAASPSSQSVTTPSSTTYSISTAVTTGSAQTVALTVSGLPAGVTAAFNPTSVTAGGGSTLTVTAGASAASGTSTLTITGTGPSATRSTTVTLVVTNNTPNFSIAVAPAGVSINSGGSGSYTVSTAVTGGSPQTVSLSVSGLPAGVSAAFNPTSVTAGGSSTLTVTAASNAAAATSTITVTGTGTVTHTATASLSVLGNNLVINGGFETGNTSGWTVVGSATAVQAPHTGTFAAQVGSSSAFNGNSTMTQTIAVPAGGTSTLTFWYKTTTSDTIQYDWQQASILNGNNKVLKQIFKVCSNAGWIQATADLTPYKGTSVKIQFLTHDDNYPGDPTYMDVDDVSVTNH